MGPNILIVDDDPNIRDTMSIHLRNAGYEVRTAKDGIDGGYAVLRKCPDLMIVDAQMPHMDGFQLVEAVRADGNQLPVVMLITHDEWDERGRNTGANGYITKPIFADKLLELIAACFPAWNRSARPIRHSPQAQSLSPAFQR
jgi:two-component system, OmpR family, response regulator